MLELEVGLVAQPTWLANRKYALVDLRGKVVVDVCWSRRELIFARL